VAKFLADRIKRGLLTLDAVPQKLKAEVESILKEGSV